MKAIILFVRFFSLGISGFTVTVFPTTTNAQEKCDGWMTYCCKCTKCLVVDPPPAYGYCRHCHLLCSNCRKELGDLGLALEKLKGRNRGLQEAYNAHQKDYTKSHEQLNDAYQRTFGEETGDWTLSGLNGSAGKFASAVTSVLTNFGGAGVVYKALGDIAPLAQSGSTQDAVINSAGLVDILGSEWFIEGFTKEMTSNAAHKMVDEIKRGIPVDQAIKTFNRESRFTGNFTKGIKVADFASTLADLWSLYSTGDALLKDLIDMKENKRDAEATKKEMDKITDEILKNLDLIQCIKETQDSLNSGGLGAIRLREKTGFYNGKTAISFLFPAIYKNMNHLFPAYANKRSVNADFKISGREIMIDTIRLNAAISQLKKYNSLVKSMSTSFEKEIFPPLIPWILNRWEELKPAILIQLLKKASPPLKNLAANGEKLKSSFMAIKEEIKASIIGFEFDYVSDENFKIVPQKEISLLKKIVNGQIATSSDKWTTTSNEKIKGELGRVNMNFPTGVEWRLEFYAAGNDYLGSRTRNDRQTFYDLAPGSYRIELNNVPVGDVSIEKGNEVKLKFGYLNIVSRGHWELHNESKEKYYKGDNKPQKLALPVGNYLLRFEEKPGSFKYYMITIKQGTSMKFELPNSYLQDL